MQWLEALLKKNRTKNKKRAKHTKILEVDERFVKENS